MSSEGRPGVLITGATGSIGACLVRAFATRGYFVGVHCHSQEDKARQLLEEVRRLDSDGVVLVADLTKSESAVSMVDNFLESSPRVDALVNNTGRNHDRLLYYMEESHWKDTLALNLESVFTVTRKVLPAMVSERRGSIINISSLSGLRGLAGQTAYAAAKAGLLGFTRSLAREVGRFNIRVNAVAPGAVRTNLGDDSNTFSLSEMSSEMERDIAAKLPHPGMVRFKPDQSGLRCLRRPLKQAMVLSRSRRRA